MKREWHPEDLAHHWTLLFDERTLLATKVGATRLSFAILLKYFQYEGRFPQRSEDVPTSVITYLAEQVGVQPEVYRQVDWGGRSLKGQRGRIREYAGFRKVTVKDTQELVAWLSEHVTHPDPNSETSRALALGHLRERHIEPPASDHLGRLLRSAIRRFEDRLCAATLARLSPETQTALDTLLSTAPDEEPGEGAQEALFPEKSSFAQLKDDPGRVSVESVLEEVAKLHKIRALAIPEGLFHNFSQQLVSHYRKRAATEKPRELRRHTAAVRYTLLAAFCEQRTREITDSLADLLILIAQRIGIRAEKKVDQELFKQFKKVGGKTQLLFQLAAVAVQHPDEAVKDVVYPVVGVEKLRALVKEHEATGPAHEREVRSVMRASYSNHYRRITPVLLEALTFRSNNDAHQPVIRALELMKKYLHSKIQFYPLEEDVPLRGVVRGDWLDLVREQDAQGEWRVNRLTFEICVLIALREKVRCKEIWVERAGRFCNPDEDLPHDFEIRRDEYYGALAQPREAEAFADRLERDMEAGLFALDAGLTKNTSVKIMKTKKGKGRFSVSPLDTLPDAPNLNKLKTALLLSWPMTSLLDILKEVELRVALTDAFHTAGAREALDPKVRQRRLLLCLYGLGTNTGLKRMGSGGGGQDTYDDLLYVRRRYIHKEGLRKAISKVCNAIFEVRRPDLWGEGTTACASDSKKFGAWDQNLMTEWHARYGGPGVMIYWHVERNSVCIYSQLKTCSSSEVAAMIEGVLSHDTDMTVEKNFVDTHGQSEVGFAFCYLLGFQLLPRLKNMKRQRLYRPKAGEPDAYKNLQAVLTRPINWDLIKRQYDEMVKYATALRLGTASAESILRRFTRSSVQHPTYRALCELGKALKTVFLCDYLRLESLRREIHEGLQVIETWNSANDFILYGKGGEFASNRREDQELLMLSLHLLQVSLVYVNTLMLQEVLDRSEWASRLTERDRHALTPLLWAHVSPYGTFTLDMNERLALQTAA